MLFVSSEQVLATCLPSCLHRASHPMRHAFTIASIRALQMKTL